MKRLDSQADLLPAPMLPDRVRPSRIPTVASDVHVPLRQGTIEAVFEAAHWAVPAWIALSALGSAFMMATGGDVLIAIGASSGVCGAGFVARTAWLLPSTWRNRVEAIDRTLQSVEAITGIDWNRDGNIGLPRPKKEYILVNPLEAQREADRRQGVQDDQLLLMFIRRCFEENKTGCDYWEGQGINRDKWRQYRDLMIGAAVAETYGESNDGKVRWRFRKGVTVEQVVRAIFGSRYAITDTPYMVAGDGES